MRLVDRPNAPLNRPPRRGRVRSRNFRCGGWKMPVTRRYSCAISSKARGHESASWTTTTSSNRLDFDALGTGVCCCSAVMDARYSRLGRPWRDARYSDCLVPSTISIGFCAVMGGLFWIVSFDVSHRHSVLWYLGWTTTGGRSMKKTTMSILACVLLASSLAFGDELDDSIKNDYESHLAALFEHFHRNPELSLIEHATAARMASELRESGFEVTEGVGGTGVVAIMRNGDGPVVMMRADMDGLPLEEKSGLAYASVATQVDPITGNSVPVMHACGHDVHIASLIGTARQMSAQKDQWSGTLMLLVQPAEERGLGARLMREDNLWERFGTPEYALAFHVSARVEAGKVNITEGSAYAGADTVDIIIHGVGAHGASPHASKDPIVLGSQIVLALQTLVARELSPRAPGVVTVGSFHSGTKRNIISDQAILQLTVRNTSEETRTLLLEGIERIAKIWDGSQVYRRICCRKSSSPKKASHRRLMTCP